jgi:chemotaxis protein methyltransferase WspC
MNLEAVIDLLRDRIGLDPESLGPTVLPRAVGVRLRALGLKPADYAARLAGDAQEFDTLVADLTVPETWFFRGAEVFPYLARHIAEAVRGQAPGQRFRILSVPCSTGEEPYSLALTLVEAGVPAPAWQIEGVDLSPRLIDQACRGRYGEFSFRQTPPELRRRYFRRSDGQWELSPDVRCLVRFRPGNLHAPFFLAGEAPFDLIFCRNLFIYLHSAARRRALDTFDRLLAPQGLLCTSPAEALGFENARFERTGPRECFLYRRPPPPPRIEDRGPRTEERKTVPSTLAPRSSILDPRSSRPVDLLARARQQADGGHLDQALATCREHLGRAGPSADLFSLMGALHQARHEADEAFRCFRRALYLDPQHRDALTHLMLCCQERGDHAQAARLRRRLERFAEGGEA